MSAKSGKRREIKLLPRELGGKCGWHHLGADHSLKTWILLEINALLGMGSYFARN